MKFNPFNAITVGKDKNEPTKDFIFVDDDYLASNIHWKPKRDGEVADWQPSTIKGYDQLRIVDLDIETEGLNPYEHRVIMLGIMIHNPDAFIDFISKKSVLNKLHSGYIVQASKPNSDVAEAKAISNFIKILFKLGAEVIPTHNGMLFDYGFIQKRIEILREKKSVKKAGIELPDLFWVSEYEKTITSASFYGRPITYHPVYTRKPNYSGYFNLTDSDVQLVDTLHLAAQLDKIKANMTSYTLKYLAQYVKFRSEKRLELSHNQIQEYWRSQDPKKLELLRQYLIYDLEDQRAVTDFFLPSVWYQKSFVNMPLQELAVASPAKKWNTILTDYYKPYVESEYTPDGMAYEEPEADDKVRYEGALVDCLPGLYKNFFKIDVSSLYPSLILRYQLMSENKDPHRVSETALRLFKELRLVFKRASGDNPREILEMSAYKSIQGFFDGIDLDNITADDKAKFSAMDASLKVCINGFYGFLGVGGYPYNSIESAALTTAYGRVLMREMRKECERWCNVINIDTDGLCLQPKLEDECDWSGIDGIPDALTPKGERIPLVKVDEDGNQYVNPWFVWHRVQELLPSDISIDVEDNYPEGAIYAPKMKNYVYWPTADSEPKTKGVYRKRNRSKLQKEFPINYLWNVAFEDDEIAQEYYEDTVAKIIEIDTNEVSSEQLELVTFTQNIPANNRTLVEAGVGLPREKVSFVWCSIQEYSPKKRLPKKKLTKFPVKVTITDSGEYQFTPQKCPSSVHKTDLYLDLNQDFYLSDLRKLKSEIDKNVGIG